jgi:hypothetical protein
MAALNIKGANPQILPIHETNIALQHGRHVSQAPKS